MDIETITKLLDAGYTKAEIDALSTGNEPAGGTDDENAGTTPPAAGNEPSNAGAENAGKVNEIGVPVEIGAAITALTDTVNGLKETVKAMQDKNAGAASTDNPKKDTVTDVMKSFIDTL